MLLFACVCFCVISTEVTAFSDKESDTSIAQAVNYKADKTNAEHMISDLLSMCFYNTIEENDVISYGSQIPIYKITDNEAKRMEDPILYPVYVNGFLNGYIRETKDFGESHFSYSGEFASEVNSFNEDKYSFAFVDDDMYIISNNKIQFLSSFSQEKTKDRVKEPSIDTRNIEYYSIYDAVKYLDNTTAFTTIDDHISFYLNIPVWDQGNTNLCWAGTAEAVGEYMTGNMSYSPSSIASQMGITGGATATQMKNTLSTLYGISTETNTSYTGFAYTVAKISSNKPVIAKLECSPKAHYMTIMGYGATSSAYYLCAMDTYGGTYRTFQLSGNTFSITYTSGNTYTWQYSIIPV